MGFLAMFTFKLDNTIATSRQPLAVMGVVDALEHSQHKWVRPEPLDKIVQFWFSDIVMLQLLHSNFLDL